MRISDWSSDVCSSDLMVVLNMCLLGMLGSDHFLLCVFARAQGYIPRDMLPNMPRKTLTTTLALREEIVLTRKQKLQRYLSVVMESPQAQSNRHMLSFLGVVNSARHESTQYRSDVPRRVIHEIG